MQDQHQLKKKKNMLRTKTQYQFDQNDKNLQRYDS